MKSFYQRITILGLLLGMLALTNFVWGFAEPAVRPPGGNISPFITTGSIAETKTGDLTLHRDTNDAKFTADQFFTFGALLLNPPPGVPNALLIPNGNVGVGAPNPQAKLHIIASNVPLQIDTFLSGLPGFTRRTPVTINASSLTKSFSNYPALVNVNTGALISAGKMQSDCGDVRVIDSDGSTLLPFWIEGPCNNAPSGNSRIWVQIPALAAGSNKTIYIDYSGSGNSGISSIQVSSSVMFGGFLGASSAYTPATPAAYSNNCVYGATSNYNFCYTDLSAGSGTISLSYAACPQCLAYGGVYNSGGSQAIGYPNLGSSQTYTTQNNSITLSTGDVYFLKLGREDCASGGPCSAGGINYSASIPLIPIDFIPKTAGADEAAPTSQKTVFSINPSTGAATTRDINVTGDVGIGASNVIKVGSGAVSGITGDYTVHTVVPPKDYVGEAIVKDCTVTFTKGILTSSLGC